MASVKGWTALLRGFFATTILPSLAARDGDGFGAPKKTPPGPRTTTAAPSRLPPRQRS